MQIRVLESALKHGLTEEDIRFALENSQMHNTVSRSGNVNKEVDLVLGSLPNGNLCEIMSTLSYDENEVVVFHAMQPPCKDFLMKIEGRKHVHEQSRK